MSANNGSTGDQDLEVGKLYFYDAAGTTAQTITFPAIPDHVSSDAPFGLSATSDSGLAVTYTVTSGPATVAGATVTLTGGLGSVSITATQGGNGTYAPAAPVTVSFNVTSPPGDDLGGSL
jgi:hypothetical protein